MKILGVRFRFRSRRRGNNDPDWLIPLLMLAAVVLVVWLALTLVVLLLPVALLCFGPLFLHLECSLRWRRWGLSDVFTNRPRLVLASLPAFPLLLAVMVLPPGLPIVSILKSPISAYGDVLTEMFSFLDSSGTELNLDPARWSGYLALLSLCLATGGLLAHPLHCLFCSSLDAAFWKEAGPQQDRKTAPGFETEHRRTHSATSKPASHAPNRQKRGNGLTFEQRQAVRTAWEYLGCGAFSRQGLIEQLKHEGFSTVDATKAVDQVDPDWFEQAVRTAREYLDCGAFSRQGLIEQLKHEGFTAEQATFGVREFYG